MEKKSVAALELRDMPSPGVAPTPWGGVTHSRIAQSSDLPMSPWTTPSAPTFSLAGSDPRAAFAECAIADECGTGTGTGAPPSGAADVEVE
ncbi:MAG: hypothetical protein ABUL77_02950 [Bacteroidota bacterium]